MTASLFYRYCQRHAGPHGSSTIQSPKKPFLLFSLACFRHGTSSCFSKQDIFSFVLGLYSLPQQKLIIRNCTIANFRLSATKEELCFYDHSADASFCFSSHRCQTAFLQFGYRRAKKIASVQRDAIPLALGFQ